jgi:hypothetical protein
VQAVLASLAPGTSPRIWTSADSLANLGLKELGRGQGLGPAHEENTIRPVHQDLEYPGHVPAVRNVAKKTRVENVGLLLIRARRATPIRPAHFGALIVVVGHEVNCREEA